MPYNPKGEWEEEPSTIKTELIKDTITTISKPINKQTVIHYELDECTENELSTALSYDRDVFDLYSLLIKENSSRTWYNKFRLDESGLNKQLNLFYNILLIRFSDFGRSVTNILQKYKLKQYHFYEYCYFQELKNIYINIKKKYSTNVINIFSYIDDAILKVYLFFLVKYFNDYISQYKNMLETIGNHQKKAIIISHNRILNNKYNKTYNSIINKSIRELNNRGSTIQENYEPYKNCIIFYERFYKVYLSLLKFLYENSYDNIEESDFYLSIQKLKNRIDKLHYLLVETVTGRIERNKQSRLNFQVLREKQQADEKARKAREASLPPPPLSWKSEYNQSYLDQMRDISPEEEQQIQNNFEISRARKLQEESNKQTIKACSTSSASMYQNDCNKAYARQAKRNRNKADSEQRYKEEYFRQHGKLPSSDPYPP